MSSVDRTLNYRLKVADALLESLLRANKFEWKDFTMWHGNYYLNIDGENYHPFKSRAKLIGFLEFSLEHTPKAQ